MYDDGRSIEGETSTAPAFRPEHLYYNQLRPTAWLARDYYNQLRPTARLATQTVVGKVPTGNPHARNE